MIDNQLSQYLSSRKKELAVLLTNNGVQARGEQLDDLLKFMVEEPDGMYIAGKARSLFKVSVEQAVRIEDQVYQTIVLPEYEAFFRNSHELQKRKEPGTIKDTDQVRQYREDLGDKVARGMRKDQGARFYFSAEDEEEIRGIMEQGTWNKKQLDQVYDRVAEEVITKVEGQDKSNREESSE